MLGRDPQIVEFILSACKSWQAEPSLANVINAARAMEKTLQLILQRFMLQAPPRNSGLNQPPTKAFSELTLGELIQAAFSPTRGEEPVVPIHFVIKAAGGNPAESLWLSAQALAGIQTSTRVYSAHSKLQASNPKLSYEPSREEKYELIQAAVGMAVETGLASPGDLEDFKAGLGREFVRSPRMAKTREPFGFASVPPPSYSKLVGRDRQLSRLIEHVEKSRLPISIEGEGGFGKSALAIELARKVAERQSFAAVVWASGKRRSLGVKSVHEHSGYIRGETALISSISKTLNLPKAADVDKLREDLDDYLRRNQTLIVIDNLEDIPETVQPAISWLAERSNVVITSRVGAHSLDKERLGPLGARELVAILRNEFQRKAGARLEIGEELGKQVYAATAGNPLGVWWLVERLRLGGSLTDLLKELQQETHHLLDYCYRNVLELVGGRALDMARILVAGKIALDLQDFKGLGYASDEAHDAYAELNRMNLVVGRMEEGEGITLTPLCQRYLSAHWKTDALQELAELKWETYQVQLGARRLWFRAGPLASSAAQCYADCKNLKKVDDLRSYATENSEDVWGWFYLGMAERQWGKPEDAIASLEHARTLALSVDGQRSEDYHQILRELAIALRRMPERRHEALELIGEAARDSADPFIEGLHAEMLCDAGQMDQGLPLLFRLIREKRHLLTPEGLRYAVVRACNFAARYPGPPAQKVKFLEDAIKLAEEHGGLLKSVDDRQALVHAYYRLARGTSNRAQGRDIVVKARQVLLPGCQVQVKGSDGWEWVDAKGALDELERRLGNGPVRPR